MPLFREQGQTVMMFSELLGSGALLGGPLVMPSGSGYTALTHGATHHPQNKNPTKTLIGSAAIDHCAGERHIFH